ncbi:MAG: hypothetical protein KJO66_05855 [Gammaproteobacteria bacterium]|nr:hypothetical protein [Gammaproteobacteria bacterium]
MSLSRKQTIFLVAAIVAVIVAMVQLWSRSSVEHGNADNGVTAQASPEAADESSEEPEVSATRDESSGDEDSALAYYKTINRYPANNRRLTDESHDLLNPGARHEQRQRLPNDPDNPDPGWEVLFTADRYYITGKENAEITLQLWHQDQPVTPEGVQLYAQTGGGSRPPLTVRTRSSSTGIEAMFRPDDAWPDYAGPVRVTARFSADGMMPQTGMLDFHFTGSEQNPGEFTGAVSERMAEGNLVFDIGVEVFIAGRFRIEANLFDALGQPFGWARFDGALDKGRQSLALVFDGLLFHDAQAKAPFLLTQVRGYRLAPEHASGRQIMTEVSLSYATSGDFELADFRDTIRISPRQQRMLDMYEEAQRRGVKLTQPEYTGN